MEALTTVTPLGVDFQMEVAARHRSWYAESGYEPLSTNMFSNAARTADVVVDIGAHVGWYAIVAARANPGARVVAIEGAAETAVVCARNCESVVPGRVDVRSAVFTAQAGEVQFEVTQASDNCSITGHPDSPTEQVQVRPAISGPDLEIGPGERLLIKVDVEGHEVAALQGISLVIDSAASVRVLVEFNPKCLRRAGSSPGDLLRWLQDRGFKTFLLEDDAERWRAIDAGLDPDALVASDSYANLYAAKGVEVLGLAFVLHSGDLGGAERSTLTKVDSLVRSGHLVHAYLPSLEAGLGSRMREVGATVSRHRASWWVSSTPAEGGWTTSGRHSEELVADLTNHPVGVIVSVTGVLPLGAMAAWLTATPHVWVLHEFIDLDHDLSGGAPVSDLGRFIARHSDAVIVNSRAVGRHVLGEAGRWTVVPPMSAAEVHGVVLQPEATQASVLGIFSGFQPKKGHADLLEALAELRAEGLETTLRIFGIGSNEDTARLEDLVRELGLGGAVVFEGHVADPTAAMAAVDVVVMPSHHEAFGRVPVEAVLVGRPVVYCRGSGMDDYMVDGVSGVACAAGDPTEFAAALRRVILDSDLRSRLRVTARRHVLEWFDERWPERAFEEVLLHTAATRQSTAWADRAMARLVGAAAVDAVASQAAGDSRIADLEAEVHRTAEEHARESQVLRGRAEALEDRSDALQDRSDALQDRSDALAEILASIESTRRFRAVFGWRSRFSTIGQKRSG